MHPKIYDCFTFFNELDILDARLHEMSPVVDRFVLVEATRTFTGKPKPLYFKENESRFSEFLPKIEHIICEFPADLSRMLGKKCPNYAWAREHYQRNQFSRGLQRAMEDDLIIVSDVDEIIREDTLRAAVSKRHSGELTVFTMPVYSHYVNRRVNSPAWELGPRMVEYRWFPGGQKTRTTKLHASKRMRGTLAGKIHTRAWNAVFRCIPGPVVEVPNSGWHLSSIGGWESYREKIAAYSHFELTESEAFKREAAYQEMISDGCVVVDNGELPRFVQDNASIFGMMPSQR